MLCLGVTLANWTSKCELALASCPEVMTPFTIAPKLLDPDQKLYLLVNDIWRWSGWILAVKGAHFSFLVQGDKVKPDSILLVVLGCDKVPDTVICSLELRVNTHGPKGGSTGTWVLKQNTVENLQLETAWEISILTALLTLPLFFLVLKDNNEFSWISVLWMTIWTNKGRNKKWWDD